MHLTQKHPFFTKISIISTASFLSACVAAPTPPILSTEALNTQPPRLDPSPYLQEAPIHHQFSNEKPNVLFIFCDDMGYGDLSCYGNTDYETPNLDQMADEGILFTQAYAAQPVCGASRAGLMTGCYPNRIGMHGAPDHRARHGINPNEWTMAEMFQEAGYRTGMAGKWHLGHHKESLPTHHGFDEFLGIPYSNDMWPNHPVHPNFYPDLPLYQQDQVVEYNTPQDQFTQLFTNNAIDFIQRNKNNPFFFYLAYPMPHVSIFASEPFLGRSGAGLYGDVITEIDDSVGRLLKTLEELNLDEKTLVVFASDNGPWTIFGNHAGSTGGLKGDKGTSLEGGVRIPMIARFKGTIPAKQVFEKATMTIDWLPTFAEMAKGKLPIWDIDGKTMWDQLLGLKHTAVQESYFIYYNQNELQAVIHNGYKLVEPHRIRWTTSKGKDGKIGTCNYPLFPRGFYNLVKDPYETQNLIYSAPFNQETKEALKSCRSEMKRMRSICGDALRNQVGKRNRPPAHYLLTPDSTDKFQTVQEADYSDDLYKSFL